MVFAAKGQALFGSAPSIEPSHYLFAQVEPQIDHGNLRDVIFL
jgi:hypothetical protein